MTLLIHGATLVEASGIHDRDLICQDGEIVKIVEPATVDPDSFAGEVLDATGQLVFPGFIDPHVHSRDPGSTNKETFGHSTQAALAGGVTTILEMPNSVPPVLTAEDLLEHARYYAERAWVDFGIWGMALGDANLSEIEELFAAGAVGVKLFWGYALDAQTKSLVYSYDPASGQEVIPPPGNAEVIRLAQEVARCGGVLGVHCEDRDVLEAGASMVVEDYADLLNARPVAAEAISVAVATEVARATGCRVHVVHLSTQTAAEIVRAGQGNGAPISAETCPQYLSLTDQDVTQGGPKMKVFPPVRDEVNQAALWAALADGTLCSVGSDHAPHTAEEKSVGFLRAPAGIPGVQTIAAVLLDGMLRGHITAQRLAAVMSTETAQLYGLWPRKGSLEVGTDADMTIVDPSAETVVRDADMRYLNPVTPWSGRQLRGRITAAVVRGHVAMRNGEVTDRPSGEFVPARHRVVSEVDS